MPSEKVDLLRKEAESRKLSVNVLANLVFDSYFDFELFAKNAGFIAFPKKTIRSMVDALAEEQVILLGKGPLKSDFTDLTYLTKGTFTLQSFLNIFLTWIRDSNFPYHDEFEEGSRNMTIHHNMGQKWSLLLKESLEQTLQDVTSKMEFEMRDDMIVLAIRE